MESMLTTVDNPFSPFTQYDEWHSFDTQAGYHTAGLLARVMKDSDELSEPDVSLAIEAAIDQVVRENVSGVHRRITFDEAEALTV